MKKRPVVLVIAGFDPSGHAGISADFKVIHSLGAHPVGVITADTVQIPGRYKKTHSLPVSLIKDQLKLLFSAYPVSAVKIGMVYSEDIGNLLVKSLTSFKGSLILDPVLKASAGPDLILSTTLKKLKKLFSLASLITPNLSEARTLTGLKTYDPERLCQNFFDQYGRPLLLKGGHGKNSSQITDLFFDGKTFSSWSRPRKKGINLHGSGCHLSAAISAECAKGKTLKKAISNAERYLSSLLNKPSKIGKKFYL